MEYQDKELVCLCGRDFIWSIGEQEFMQSLYEQSRIKNIIQPKRCEACRLAKKEKMENRGEKTWQH